LKPRTLAVDNWAITEVPLRGNADGAVFSQPALDALCTMQDIAAPRSFSPLDQIKFGKTHVCVQLLGKKTMQF